MIRAARVGDFDRLRAIEVAAGQAFRAVGLAGVADDEPPADEVLAGFAGRAWVAEVRGRVGAYLLAEVVDECAHIAQVSADPAHRGLGLGRALVDHLDGWAAERGLAGLTLTTFADVPWNGPYYRRLGFRVIAPTPALAAVVAHEAALGLDPTTRVCMRRDLGVGVRPDPR